MSDKNNKRKVIWQGEYTALWNDGEIGVSDGVGFVGVEDDIEGLYKALKKLLNK